MPLVKPAAPPVGSLQAVEVGVGVVEERVDHGGDVPLGRGVLLADDEGLDGRVPRRPRLGHGHLGEEYPELRVEEGDVPPTEYLGHEATARSGLNRLDYSFERNLLWL